jgi:benzodiazapine receptor
MFIYFALFLTAAVAAASTGMLFPTGAWYRTLTKPTWVPANWVFPIVWTSIYLLISFAGARVAMAGGGTLALAFWAVQIALNTLWTPVFFGLRHWRASLIVMAGLWLAVLACVLTHFAVDLWAGLAFVPYLIWVTIAAALNLSITRLNPDQKPLRISDI